MLERMRSMGRKIGLDVGDKTIGVAVSDALGWTAQGVTTIERVGIKKDTTRVVEYIREYECDTVVIGLPKKLDGTDSPQTEKVYEFRERLSNKMRSQGLGDVAIRKGYQAYKIEYLIATSLVLIVFVQLVQSIGNRIYNKLS